MQMAVVSTAPQRVMVNTPDQQTAQSWFRNFTQHSHHNYPRELNPSLAQPRAVTKRLL